MDSYRSTLFERTALSYSIEGMAPREELLFKAFLRLLDHLTHQKWCYQTPDSTAPIDLLVAAPGGREVFAGRVGRLPPTVLALNGGGDNRPGQLSWPLRPDTLEKELNRLGGLVLTLRSPVQASPSEALFTGLAPTTHGRPGVPTDQLRLQRWPPSHLLAGPGRMRLATLLTSKAMTLDELVHRSALPRSTCKNFVNELHKAKLLVDHLAPPQPKYGYVPMPGHQNVTNVANLKNTANVANLKKDSKLSVPSTQGLSLSLLSRIRSRLGMAA